MTSWQPVPAAYGGRPKRMTPCVVVYKNFTAVRLPDEMVGAAARADVLVDRDHPGRFAVRLDDAGKIALVRARQKAATQSIYLSVNIARHWPKGLTETTAEREGDLLVFTPPAA